MPDDPKTAYRATLNLPDTPFPMRVDLGGRRISKEKEWKKNNESAYGAREIKQPLRNSFG